ncbi:MAG: class I SAM-dependent methyltransferase [Actinomycetota bacterium]|nr:class I SAM-dependent methyltransferase [Actinomycetota bacterium]
MRVSRRFSLAVQYILDEWVPPVVRDSRWFMGLPMRFVMRDATNDFMTFKDSVFGMDDESFSALYERTAHVQQLQGETDLNQRCTDEILRSLAPGRILEVGCGRGYLAGLMAGQGRDVTGFDIAIADDVRSRHAAVQFLTGNIESLPFPDGSFDVVVTTHTLEHVQNLSTAVAELRRVAKRQLIIVVPRQRPYRYTFSLHTQFFPYEWSLHSAFGYRKNAVIKRLGDWYYMENIQPE